MTEYEKCSSRRGIGDTERKMCREKRIQLFILFVFTLRCEQARDRRGPG